MPSFKSVATLTVLTVLFSYPYSAYAQGNPSPTPPLTDVEKVINLAKEMEAKHGDDIRKKAYDMAVDIKTNHPEELEAAKRMGNKAYRKAVKNLRQKREELLEAEKNGTLTAEQAKELALIREARRSLKAGLKRSQPQPQPETP